MSAAPPRAQPYPPLLRRVLRASVFLWLLVRAAYAWMAVYGSSGSGPFSRDEAIAAALHPTPLSRLALIALTAFLVWLDRRRAHEPLLQGNFGVSPLWFLGASAFAAGFMDVTVQTILGGLR